MFEDRIKPATVAVLAAIRKTLGATGLEVVRGTWWNRARPAIVPWLEQPAFPVAHLALVAALLFAWWIQPPAEVGRYGDGWRYLTVTWQRPEEDVPTWLSAGPVSWVTEGRVEARWGKAQWSTASMNGLFAPAA